MKRKRIAAIAVVFPVIFSLLFSVIFPSAQAGHVHENEETCTICATVRECNELSRRLSAAVISSKEETAPAVRYISGRVRKARGRHVRRATPVSLKVKLIN